MSSTNHPRSRQRTIRAEAVVLRYSNWGEADRLISLYAFNYGKLRAIAKGVRKPHSRKAGHLEPFTRTNLLMARGRDLYIITQAETIDAYLKIRKNLMLTTYAAYIVELLDKFLFDEEEGQNHEMYHLLVNTLSRLGNANNPELAIRYYEMHLLGYVGFRPQLFTCTNCNETIQAQDQFFSTSLGGAVCPNCKNQVQDSRVISMRALKYLRHFQRSSYNEAARAPLTSSINAEIESIMEHYITYHLERQLNSPRFISILRNEAGSR